MELLKRIARTFENIRTTIKTKSSSERVSALRKDIQCIVADLAILRKEDQGQFIRYIAMEGYLALLSAKTMPLTLIEKRNILQLAFEKLKPLALSEECLFIYLRIQNLYCYYLIQLDQAIAAREILEGTEDLYDKISKCQPDKYMDAEDLFTMDPLSMVRRVNPEKIDKVITNNVQMQAFLYNKLNLPDKYCLYNHTALRRQLELKEGTPQEWALRTARLGNYFTYLQQMGNSRHHLCAAYHVLRTCHDNCKMMPADIMLHKADFEIHFLELSHHWVKYGLTLFKLSKKNVLNKFFAEDTCKADLWKSVDAVQPENMDKFEDENMTDIGMEKSKGDANPDKLFLFPSLDLKEMEARVPRETVSTIEEAKKLFAFTHKWLKRTKHYYDFEHFAAQYISCSLQLSELYEHLAFFEKNLENQYSIQKRRADILESLNALLKTCDGTMSVQIDVIRELSQVQLELMALNLQKLWRDESQTNIFHDDADSEFINNSLDSGSNKTLGRVTGTSKNTFLRKMEAASSINGKLFRLSGHIGSRSPSMVSFASGMVKL